MQNLLVVVHLTEPEKGIFSYGTGLESWLSARLPEVQLLDLDSGSDKGFALQIRTALQEAKKAVLWVKSDSSDNSLGVAAPLIEFVIRNPEKCLLLLQGNNTVVERIGKAAMGNFMGGGEEELKRAVSEFLG